MSSVVRLPANLNIDLINPFGEAYAILAKTMSKKSLKQIALDHWTCATRSRRALPLRARLLLPLQLCLVFRRVLPKCLPRVDPL